MSSRSRGRLAAVLLLAAAVQFMSVPSPATAACRGADSLASQASYSELGRTTVCLVNRERRSRGLRGLRTDRRLGLAARRHAVDMVRHSYFTHKSRSGAEFTARIVKAGYLRGIASWTVGENLAWGGGRASTPRRIVGSWMLSPSHRANILDRAFRDIGVGVAAGVPVPNGYSAAATYVHEFGVVR